ncbi:MAG: ABC-type Fe3+-hydroxamate transport system, periplasmic component [Halonotius sp. J07HN4]|nr:MAG: ABC-type Fe3+-hydroxamate transport system, periplasmic component [Halonotius sp. J07HN4]
MRVVSLLPSCTEVLFAVGVEPVGVSHSCDHPPAVDSIPTVTTTVVDHENHSAAEIDAQMQSVNGAVYDLHLNQLAALQPDLVVTQATCDVCAVDASQVHEAVAQMTAEPDVLTLDPHSFSDVLDDIQRIGEATEATEAATTLTTQLRTRVEQVESRAETAVKSNGRPRTAVLDWTDPPLRAGHWVTEMIERAGGDASFQPDGASEPVSWATISDYDPERLVVTPCGFDCDRAVDAIEDLRDCEGWENVTAVENGAVYAVDGNALFNRPSHRLVESLELLQWCIHPDTIERSVDDRSYVQQLDSPQQPSV